MSTYLTLTSQNTINQWPVQEHDIRAAHPHTSFPSPLQPEDVADMGYIAVMPTVTPEHSAWTHKSVADIPEFVPDANDGSGVWMQRWKVLELPEPDVATSLINRCKMLVQCIDADVDMLISRVIGNRAQEYELAEREALAFISAGYPASAVPTSVQSDADAYKQSAQWSADRIAATAVAWRSAQASMRAQRLAHKAQATEAKSHAELTSIESSWTASINALRDGLLS